jgi:hypothetical protein
MFMPPAVTDFIKRNLVARVGPLATLLIVCGVVFGVGIMIERIYIDSQDNFAEFWANPGVVYAVIATAVTAVGYYVLAYLLSSMFPKLQQIKLLGMVGLVAAVTFIGVMLDSRYVGLLLNDSEVLDWVLRLVFAGGIAYLFSDLNQFIPDAGEPRLNRNMTIIVTIALAAISAGVWILFGSFGSRVWLAGLLGGFVYGVVVSFLLFLALVESGGVVALEAEKPKPARKPRAKKPKAEATEDDEA